jgi:N-acetylmuramoyl-L-alanine amidase
VPRVALIVSAVAFFAAPAAASADFVHIVEPGESLYSVAAADGLSVDQLAAANGLSPDTQLVAGTDLQIPPQGAAVPASTGTADSGDGDGDSDDGVSDAASSSSVSSSSSSGSYIVQPGDTLSGIAARAGISVAALAADNGLDPNGLLPAGAVLALSGGGSTGSSASSQPVGASAEGSSGAPPYPTAETVSPSEVGSIASANDVSPSLADAIADQESGFNNDLVSSADARGVMQILPGTWDWIQHSLDTGGPPLAPASAADNVRGGVLMLHSLLDATGGDPAMAAAGYYQGLPSVQQHGMYRDTQQYVQSVLALERQFGGGG